MEQQSAIIAWTLAACVVLFLGLCSSTEALLGMAIGYSATMGAPVLQRWFTERRRS